MTMADDIDDVLDREREAARRPSPCCAPTMCPTCWDLGGHAPLAS